MPKVKKIKIKTHSSSKKRFKITGTGKIKMKPAYTSHILNSQIKSTKRKRKSRKTKNASSPDEKRIKMLIPYKK